MPLNLRILVNRRLHVEVPRARRFEIQGRIRYRTEENCQWLVGRIKDVSKTGVRFIVGRPPKNNHRIKKRLMFPIKHGEFRLEIACTGQVVRRAATGGGSVAYAVAATINRYRILRQATLTNDGRGRKSW